MRTRTKRPAPAVFRAGVKGRAHDTYQAAEDFARGLVESGKDAVEIYRDQGGNVTLLAVLRRNGRRVQIDMTMEGCAYA